MSVWDQAVDVLRESTMAYAFLFNRELLHAHFSRDLPCTSRFDAPVAAFRTARGPRDRCAGYVQATGDQALAPSSE